MITTGSGKNLLGSSGIPPSTYINSRPGKDGTAKILVIHDDQSIRSLLDMLVTRRGYEASAQYTYLCDGYRRFVYDSDQRGNMMNETPEAA